MSKMITALDAMETIAQAVITTGTSFKAVVESEDLDTIGALSISSYPLISIEPFNERVIPIASGWVTVNPNIIVSCYFTIGNSNVKTVRRASIPLAESLFEKIKAAKFSSRDNIVSYGLDIVGAAGKVVRISTVFTYNL